MLNPEKKYNYDYYMDLVDQIVKMGAHVLGTENNTFKTLLLADNTA